jgi:hypothetical protein
MPQSLFSQSTALRSLLVSRAEAPIQYSWYLEDRRGYLGMDGLDAGASRGLIAQWQHATLTPA